MNTLTLFCIFFFDMGVNRLCICDDSHSTRWSSSTESTAMLSALRVFSSYWSFGMGTIILIRETKKLGFMEMTHQRSPSTSTRKSQVLNQNLSETRFQLLIIDLYSLPFVVMWILSPIPLENISWTLSCTTVGYKVQVGGIYYGFVLFQYTMMVKFSFSFATMPKPGPSGFMIFGIYQVIVHYDRIS